MGQTTYVDDDAELLEADSADLLLDKAKKAPDTV